MSPSGKLRVEIQFFNGCPNAEEMIRRVKAVCALFGRKINYKEHLVETREEAERIKFRGSPTVLINGLDLENMQEPDSGTMACRYYPGGLPTVNKIETVIRGCIKSEDQK
jgi:hypothetical protein